MDQRTKWQLGSLIVFGTVAGSAFVTLTLSLLHRIPHY